MIVPYSVIPLGYGKSLTMYGPELWLEHTGRRAELLRFQRLATQVLDWQT